MRQRTNILSRGVIPVLVATSRTVDPCDAMCGNHETFCWFTLRVAAKFVAEMASNHVQTGAVSIDNRFSRQGDRERRSNV